MEIENKKLESLETNFVVEPEKKAGFLARLSAGSEKDAFIENLSLLLASGMDTATALSALKREAKSAGMKEVIAEVESSVEGGAVLSEALSRTGLYGANITSLIRIGEQTGKLAENMRVVAAQSQKERSFRAKIASAMMYPVLVLALTLIIGVSISWLVLPRLANVFSQLKIQLPWLTQFLIDAGEFLGQYGAIFVPSLIAVLLLLIYIVFVFPKTKHIGQELLFSFPGIGELVAEVELARFGYMLGSMLGAGLPVVTAFDSLIEVTQFRTYRKLYTHLRDRIEEGNSFAKSFAAYSKIDSLIPPSIQQMIIAGEQSGFLSDALLVIGERYEEKTEVSTKNISTLLEPILLIIVWFGVAAIALAVILPIYSLVGGFTQSGQGVTPAAVVSPTATPEITLTPTATPTPARQIVVNDTDIGYLNVRSGPSLSSSVIERAFPGDRYPFVDRQGDWYQIILPEGGRGWVNAAYVEELP